MSEKLRFILINPTAPQWRVQGASAASRRTRAFRFSMLPSLYVAAAMPPDVETQIVDEDVEPIPFDTDADIVGISFMTYNALRAYELADHFRHVRGKTVIFGGFHPTFMPDEAIAHADAICIGEAEKSVPLMISDYRSGCLKKFYESGPIDLKGLPIPNRKLIQSSAYITPFAVQATRGCPNHCKFCSVSAFARHRHRVRPVNEVIEELRTLGNRLLFMDDNIVAEPEYAKELFAKMIPLKKKWVSQGGIQMADDPELLRLAAASGCNGLFVGLESISQKTLNTANKSGNRASDYASAIRRMHGAGIGVFAGFVFGLDGDRPDIFRRTLEFMYESRIDLVQITIQTPFPGTALFDDLDRSGRIFDKNWCHYDFGHVVFEPRHMSAKILLAGSNWVRANFYSWSSTALRLARMFSFMPPATMLSAAIPLNLGYRVRCRKNQVFERAKTFDPQVA